MKKITLGILFLILFILGMLFIFSCTNYKFHEEKIIMQVISKNYVKQHDDFTYHYGYSVMKGSFCWYWGTEHFPAKFNVTLYNNEEDSLKLNDEKLYSTYNPGDSVILIKRLCFDADKDTIHPINKSIYYK